MSVHETATVENAALEDRVQVGPNASVLGVTHELGTDGMEHRNDQFEAIVLEAGSFVGAGAVVLPGLRIGENAVVGANVTVTDDVPAGTVLRGWLRGVTDRTVRTCQTVYVTRSRMY